MKSILLLLFTTFTLLLEAQQFISLDAAIDSALQNNFDIKIARNNAEIQSINNSYGMAGGLPSVNVSVTNNNTLNSVRQELNSGSTIERNNVEGNTLNSGITASLVLFNGFKILATKQKLNLLEEQGELQLNNQVQNVMAQVMTKYYDIIRQQSYLKIIESSIEVSEEKLNIIRERYNVGMANDADLLQAQIDVNNARQSLESQQLIIDQTKTDLVTLMNIKNQFKISIKDTILVDKTLNYDTIISNLNKNPQYLSVYQQVNINRQIVKELSAQRWPSIKLNTGYNLNYSKSGAGLTLLNQNYGPFIGATMQIPVFNGNIYYTQQKVATYNVKNAILQQESLLSGLKSNTDKTWLSYQNTIQRINKQVDNFQLSERLVKLVLVKFQVSQATILDVKTAQSSFENTAYQLVNLQYAAKISEIELKRLIYRLGR